MALAQGSGELIWWPYLMAKYGLGFLFLLVPACLLQYPLTYNVGQYTMLTGESIFQGFTRVSPVYSLGLWVLLIVHFLWFGAFASAGATALVELTGWPPAGWFENGGEGAGRRLVWAYLLIAVCFGAVMASGVIYAMLEKVMWVIAGVTFVGLGAACLHPAVREHWGAFGVALVIPPGELAQPWDGRADLTRLLTAVTFAGLGGFWLLFYSYWIREKNVGMAAHFGRITGPLTGRPETIPEAGFAPEPEAGGALARKVGAWRRYLLLDGGIGVFGNVLTTLMTCLLAYALLLPKGLLPAGEELAVVQAEFFGNAWGAWGRAVFLLIAAAFLADTWIATADAVARIHTDCVVGFFPRARGVPARRWYVIFFVALTAVTSVTLPLAQPGKLILLNAVIGVVATVAYSFGLLALNVKMRRELTAEARPSAVATWLLGVSAVFYLGLTVAYFVARWRYG